MLHSPRSFHAARRILIAVAAALAATVTVPLAVSADTVMTIPTVSQQYGGWASLPLGSSPTDTIGSSGCAITAVTMMLDYYGVVTDPGSLNTWLTANGGYLYDDDLLWSAVDAFSGGRVQFSAWLSPDLGVILNELDYGRPVIAEVSLDGNQHFVLITGYTSAGGLQINDPWFGDSVNLGDRYPGILSMRTFTPADSPLPRVGGQVH